MKEQQIRIEIAQACGWKFRTWVNYEGWEDPHGIRRESIPDYLNDLNAMHEAEKTLKSYGPDDLDRTVSDRMIEYAERLNYEIDATAAQRAEELLKTLNRWKP